MSNYTETMKNFEEFLAKSNYNCTAKFLEGSSDTGFYAELLTNAGNFFVKIRVDESIEFVVVEVYPGIKITPSRRAVAAQLIQDLNDEKKVGNIRLNYKHGDVYSHLETSIKDAPASGATLEKLIMIAITHLLSCKDSLEELAHGQESNTDTAKVIKTIRELSWSINEEAPVELTPNSNPQKWTSEFFSSDCIDDEKEPEII